MKSINYKYNIAMYIGYRFSEHRGRKLTRKLRHHGSVHGPGVGLQQHPPIQRRQGEHHCHGVRDRESITVMG